ncbi:MAG: aminomethyl-transferring glycine dehydrogenase [Melioribacteraceae bacterium]|jgi:glycine dehydrogenase|nr:aminomethyl-transferring glycine dehydrogenase [Melioribacteraceae bacterium]
MNFEISDKFVDRHIGPNQVELNEMLEEIGFKSTEELLDKVIHKSIRLKNEIDIGKEVSEFELLTDIKTIAKKNKVFKSFIGLGYYPTITPAVIQRNIFENPGWYTQYTPYQAEISQGRLEALLNYQTMVADLTALPLTNASLLDEATAAAEAMFMFYNSRKKDRKNSNVFLVADDIFPQTLDVLKTRANPIGIELRIVSIKDFELTDDIFGMIVQYPNADGEIIDYSDLFAKAEEKAIFKVVAADLLSLSLLKAPGEFGADCAVGSTQRFGVPMGFGGPHAGYFATKEMFKRQIPGRIIGVSVDSNGNPALRMALQTREQHIKREKATSNICTSQVLLAIMAGMYAVYHGPVGINNIATRINKLATLLAEVLQNTSVTQINKNYFDTIKLRFDNLDIVKTINKIAISKSINLRYIDEVTIGISISEMTLLDDIIEIANVIREAISESKISIDDVNAIKKLEESYNNSIKRESEYLTHKVFNSYHSETELMRYAKKLENKDLSLTTSMIPLGSCTMKLNAAAELYPVSWSEFNQLHPFAPVNQAEGYLELFKEFEEQICEITGFAAASIQPNSGAQGEYAGLMVIREYHKNRGDGHRNIVLIPSSAHGTNPASSVMAGNKVVLVACDDYGNVSLEDLKAKAEEHKDNLSAMMLTYPSTHGVFEHKVIDMCEIIHENGAQVYMDGANMNAQVGYTNPAIIGADVCHLNLHKTFAIPHGGGGPGVGPILVAKHLVEFLPGHSVVDINKSKSISAVSAAPWGSASVIPISYAYIKMMGSTGLKEATAAAIINANYIKAKLQNYFPVLYTGVNGNVGHELIFDIREFKVTAGIGVVDIAKRLMDYGYHAPTVSFPVGGTLMVEPTESESKVELDKFCDAMISISNEIKQIENNEMDKVDNPLKNAPHTCSEVTKDNWSHSYSREVAAFPFEQSREYKYWPSVGRVDDAYGDRNLVCSCLPISEYEGD